MGLFSSIKSIFASRKKHKELGIGNDPANAVRSHRIIEAANLYPFNFEYTEAYARHLCGETEQRVIDTLKAVSIDDLNAQMFDSLIDSHERDMEASAELQHSYHLQSIHRIVHMIDEELILTEKFKTEDERELSEVEAELARYAALME